MPSEQTRKFIQDIRALKLRFPVADIVRATGYNKSNVSLFLGEKKEPTSNFLKKFYEVYDRQKNVLRYPEEEDNERKNEVNEPEISIVKNDLDKFLEIAKSQAASIGSQAASIDKLTDALTEQLEILKSQQQVIFVMTGASRKGGKKKDFIC